MAGLSGPLCLFDADAVFFMAGEELKFMARALGLCVSLFLLFGSNRFRYLKLMDDAGAGEATELCLCAIGS